MDSAVQDAFKLLSLLEKVQAEPELYYRGVAGCDDEILRVGAWCALFDLNKVRIADCETILSLSHHGAIRQRLFEFYEGLYEYELAAEMVATSSPVSDDPLQLEIEGRLALDDDKQLRGAEARFFATCASKHLLTASSLTEASKGWRPSLVWLVRAMIIFPVDEKAANRFVRTLAEANQFNAVARFATLLAKVDKLPYTRDAFQAWALQGMGEAQSTIDIIGRLLSTTLPDGGK